LAPTQITTTTGLNTFHKPKSNDATTLKASFKKSLLTLKHVITLANNHLHKHMRPIFQHQHCTLTDPESGVKNEFLIGHGSNNPWFLSAENVPIEVAGTLACLVDTSSMEVPHCYCSGPFFMATNITGTTTLVLQEGTSNKVVHLPLTLLIPFDINDTTKGTITEASLDILDTTIQDGAFWACCILDHIATHSAELVCCTSEGLCKARNHLCPGHTYSHFCMKRR
jgi:hypothetical protein